MSKKEEAQEEILDDADLEKSFNESLEDLKKSLGDEEEQEEEDLEKAKKNPPKKSDAEPEDEEEAEEEEEEEEGYEEKVKKSIEDQLGEDPEAEAAMDVEPFLRSLVKSIDEAIQNVRKEIVGKIAEAECLLKSQGKLLVAQAELQKSVQEKVEKMANTPMPSNSLRALQKSRFETGEKNIELSGVEILEKSRNWVREGKIDLVEAGIIESRVNKGMIGKVDDVTDKKVKNLLMKEVG